MALCFMIYGQGYPTYFKVMKLGMGIDVLARSNFYRVIELAYPHVKNILNDMCELAKKKMQSRNPIELGSWTRAVTTSDGCWLIRGFHSQCSTFVIIDFLTGGILYYGHLCMRGSNNICDDELWKGTAKAAEGHLAHVLFAKAKGEGMQIELNWQDQDSSSGLSFRSVFPDGALHRIMLCGGHVGRSHGNNLKEYKGKKVLEKAFMDKHKEHFPEVTDVTCVCAGKKHSKNCGCLSDNFIAACKRNHFSALKQSGNDPEEYARRMRVLGKYHSRDVHTWSDEDGEHTCGFHPLQVCSCGKCSKGDKKEDVVPSSKEIGGVGSIGGTESSDDGISGRSSSISEFGGDGSSVSVDGDSSRGIIGVGSRDSSVLSELRDSESSDNDSSDSESSDSDDESVAFKCKGKPYSTRLVLKCPLHSLLYEIECNRVARKASEVVHNEMGRGHSNLPESKFHVLTRFRPKNVNLQQLHYEFITNVGLCQSNMSFMYKVCGPQYHWLKEILLNMGLPIPEGIEDVWEAENSMRMKGLEKQKMDKAKAARARRKQNRLRESKERSKFGRRQQIVHNYGNEGEDVDESDVIEKVHERMKKGSNQCKEKEEVAPPKGAVVTIGGKCRCGSNDHSRTSHKSCKLNKKILLSNRKAKD